VPPRFAPSIGEHTEQLLAEFGMVDQIDMLAETRAIDLREDPASS